MTQMQRLSLPVSNCQLAAFPQNRPFCIEDATGRLGRVVRVGRPAALRVQR